MPFFLYFALMKKLILVPFLFFLSHVRGGGFQVNLQGQKQTGMGHTGTGLLHDASSILFNPGALCFLDSVNNIILGSSFIIPRTQYLEPAPGTYTEQLVPHVGTPFTVYAAWKFHRKSAIYYGLGIYTPFGSRVQWPDGWKGQFLIREIDLKTIFIQPTVSWKVNDKLGIGAGPVFATGGFSLRKGIPVQDSTGVYGEGFLEGKASGFGFNAALYYRFNDRASIGISYRSQVKVNVKHGDAEFKVPSSLEEYFPTTHFTSSIKLPQTISFGSGYHFNKKLTFALDVNYVGWKCYDSLKIDFEDTTSKLQNIHSARMYNNSFIYRLGAQYKLNDLLTLRMGAYFDSSPVGDGYLTPETPDANKIGITAGATIALGYFVHLDLSFLYIESMKRTDTNLETQFSGTYKTRAVAPGFALEFLF
jgi:long-chain fatty acid transport protein